VPESNGGNQIPVVGSGAIKHNNLCCHSWNMAGIANVAGVAWLAPEEKVISVGGEYLALEASY